MAAVDPRILTQTLSGRYVENFQVSDNTHVFNISDALFLYQKKNL